MSSVVQSVRTCAASALAAIRARLPRRLMRAVRTACLLPLQLWGTLQQCAAESPSLQLLYDLWRFGPLGRYIWLSRQVPGWTRGAEALALAYACKGLAHDAVVVEIGAFLGSGTILMAGALKVRASGQLHVIDPFDASGDGYSAPIYRAIESSIQCGLRQRFDEHVRRAGLSAWVSVHQGRDTEIAKTWTMPISLLFMDGDQSAIGARAAFESWSPFIECGGVIAIHNSRPDVEYARDHDGQRRLVEARIHPPRYIDVWCTDSTTFARKAFS